MKNFQKLAAVSTLILGLNFAIPLSAIAQPTLCSSPGSCGTGVETVQPGILQLTDVPANFSFDPVAITSLQTYNTIHVNNKFNSAIPDLDPTKENGKVTAGDKRFSGGFEVQISATDHIGQNAPQPNPPNKIPVSNLGVLTQVPNSTNNYLQTTNLQNGYTRTETGETLITGSQVFGAVINQTIPFDFAMFGRESKQLYICTSGLIVQGADVLAVNNPAITPGDFNSFCQTNADPPAGHYGIMTPYFVGGLNTFTTLNTSPFDSNNGVYFNQISDNEIHIRYKGNITNGSNANLGSAEYSVFIFKDSRIEYHYGPNSDSGQPLIAIYNNDGNNLIQANKPPFDTISHGSDVAFKQIRFSPSNAIFNDVTKPETPPVFAYANANSNSDPGNYTMFTEDPDNAGFSIPVTILQGAACDSQGRLGDYTVYPSFLLQVPGSTAADTYQNSITFTIIDKTIPTTATATATATATMNGDAIGSIAIDNAGKGYTAPPIVTIEPPASGTTATATAVLGGISNITVTNPGSGYTSAPNVTIDPPASGTTATATAALGGTLVSGITISAVGSGYTTAPAVTIDPPPSGSGGTTATATASLGALSGITVNSGSSGTYTHAPNITIAPPSTFCPSSGGA